MKIKGLTLIEIMIGVAIIAIIVSVVVRLTGDRTTCINGYVFAESYTKYGNLTQILDDKGHGIKCDRS